MAFGSRSMISEPKVVQKPNCWTRIPVPCLNKVVSSVQLGYCHILMKTFWNRFNESIDFRHRWCHATMAANWKIRYSTERNSLLFFDQKNVTRDSLSKVSPLTILEKDIHIYVMKLIKSEH